MTKHKYLIPNSNYINCPLLFYYTIADIRIVDNV